MLKVSCVSQGRRTMKSKTSKQNEFDAESGFEIRDPLWALWMCLIGVVGGIIVFFVFLHLKHQNIIDSETLCIGYIFLALSLLSALGVYAWCRERLIYSRRAYTYYKAFGKAQSASVSEIVSVKILTVYYLAKHGIRSKIRIFFYDKQKNVLIRIIDDGTLSKNEIFLKSLKYNRIKIIREEKYDY